MRRSSSPVAICVAFAVAATALPARAWERSSTPQETWTFTSFRATYGYTQGMREGHRATDMQPIGLAYSEQVAGAEFELEDYDARRPGRQQYPDFLGIGLGLRMIARLGVVIDSDYAQEPGVEAASGPRGEFRLSFGGGTMAQLARGDDFVLALHFSFELHAPRATWSQDVAFTPFPGLRMIWQPSPLRLQLAYDFLPFWVGGQGRMEHRASAAAAVQLGSIGLGVRFAATIGQERLGTSRYDDLTLGGALELVL